MAKKPSPKPTATPKSDGWAENMMKRANQWMHDNIDPDGKNVRAQSATPSPKKSDGPSLVDKAKGVKRGYDSLKDAL